MFGKETQSCLISFCHIAGGAISFLFYSAIPTTDLLLFKISHHTPPPWQMVVKTFMDMDQDSEEEKELYLNLALHLASDFFLKHPDKDVRLLVACCLADIFRIYAPEAPYTSPDKLKVQWVFGCGR